MTVEVSQKIAGDAVGNRAAGYFSILSSMARAASHYPKTLVTNCLGCERSEMFTPRRTRASSSGAAFWSLRALAPMDVVTKGRVERYIGLPLYFQ